jgi:hypothetical protein
MPFPSKITGAGNYNAQQVFKVTFSEALSTAPTLEALDNLSTFPVVDSQGSTVLKEIFTGTTGNGNKPMLYAKMTTAELPGENWKPATATSGVANPNRLKDTQSSVGTGTIPAGYFLFNLGLEVPFDASVPSEDSMNFLLQVRYTYSGDQPDVKFYGNTGTEGTPVYEEIVPDTNGIQFGDLNTDWSSTPVLTLPEEDTIDAPEIGVTL